MEVEINQSAFRKFKRLVKKDPHLPKVIDKKVALFVKDPNYPSLRLHKVDVGSDKLWSISIKENLRILFYFKKNAIIVSDIGDHDEVY